MAFRWLVFEPYIIPSGSMMPTLLINDHILVDKWAYGLRIPFGKTWVVGPKLPERGEVAVFRSVERESVFFVKRIVGLPGDHIKFSEKGRSYCKW